MIIHVHKKFTKNWLNEETSARHVTYSKPDPMAVCVCGWTSMRKTISLKKFQSERGQRLKSLKGSELLRYVVINRPLTAIPKIPGERRGHFFESMFGSGYCRRGEIVSSAYRPPTPRLIVLHGWRDQFTFRQFDLFWRLSFPIIVLARLSAWHCRTSFWISCGRVAPSRNRRTTETFSRIRNIASSNCFHVCWM